VAKVVSLRASPWHVGSVSLHLVPRAMTGGVAMLLHNLRVSDAAAHVIVASAAAAYGIGQWLLGDEPGPCGTRTLWIKLKVSRM
jgi:hypothetical protein